LLIVIEPVPDHRFDRGDIGLQVYDRSLNRFGHDRQVTYSV